MAKRINPVHAQAARDKIRTSQLINRLQNHVLRKTKLSNTQIRAIQILLAKTLPDLKAVEFSGHIDADVTVTHITEELIEP